jgi:hypothetical protein
MYNTITLTAIAKFGLNNKDVKPLKNKNAIQLLEWRFNYVLKISF